MAGNLRFFLALLRMTFKSAAMQRQAILIRAGFSVITHLIYIPVWVVIFSIAPDIGGWTLHHAMVAYGISIACWGFVSLIAFGLRTIPEQIDHGELDAYLTYPSLFCSRRRSARRAIRVWGRCCSGLVC